MSRFKAVTTVVPTEGPGGEGVAWWSAALDPDWAVGKKPNGGYLLAVLTRAALAALPAHPDPLAASATYLQAPDPGPVTLRTQVLRAGRTAGQVAVELWQGDQRCVASLHTLGTLDPGAEPWWSADSPVELPEIGQCIRLDATPPGTSFRIPLFEVVAEHLDPAVLGYAHGRPTGVGELRGWAELADGAPWDPVSLLLALDCFPPVTLNLGSQGWVPTLELTCCVRGLPAPGPLRIRQRGRWAQDGRIDEVCEAWDSRGRLVGQATQLATFRVADGAAPVRPG